MSLPVMATAEETAVPLGEKKTDLNVSETSQGEGSDNEGSPSLNLPSDSIWTLVGCVCAFRC